MNYLSCCLTVQAYDIIKPGMHRLAHAWFLEIAFVHDVSMHVCLCVCPPPRLLVTSGVIWCDYDIELL